MLKPQFIKFYYNVWENEDVKRLKDCEFKFLIYLLFKSYKQINKNSFNLSPASIYNETKISHCKLWRMKKSLNSIKIKINYVNKEYAVNLSEFFKEYYP